MQRASRPIWSDFGKWGHKLWLNSLRSFLVQATLLIVLFIIRETEEIREIEKTQRKLLEDEFYFLLNESIQKSQHVYIYSRVPSNNNQLTDSYYTC